jgi:hypothetical protein
MHGVICFDGVGDEENGEENGKLEKMKTKMDGDAVCEVQWRMNKKGTEVVREIEWRIKEN